MEREEFHRRLCIYKNTFPKGPKTVWICSENGINLLKFYDSNCESLAEAVGSCNSKFKYLGIMLYALQIKLEYGR